MRENQLGILLKELRTGKGWKVKEFSALTDIDQALISKIEHGRRLPTEGQLDNFCKIYPDQQEYLRKMWLADKIFTLVEEYPDLAHDALLLAEPRIEYLSSSAALEEITISPEVTQRLNYLDTLKAKWKKKRPIAGMQLQKLKEYIHTEYTYESNRIEGNTLTLSETHLVIKEGIIVSGKSLHEHLEAINHVEAIHFVEDLVLGNADFNNRNLLQIHSLILRGIDRKYAGRYRDVPVRIGGSKHLPPEPYLIDKMMEDYFIHYRNHAHRLHPAILAAEMHERLVSIHPFIDGNGRTARLVMNFILLKNGFTIANLKGDQQSRLAYYQALEKVQKENEPEHFYGLILDTLIRDMEEVLKMV